MKSVFNKSVIYSIMCMFLLLASCAGEQKAPVVEKQEVEEPQFIIVAHVTTTEEHKADLLKAFQAVIKGTREEAGNVYYNLNEHVDNPLKFTFIEGWKSQAAIDSHNSSVHFQEFAKAIEGKAELEVYVMKKKY